MQAGDLIGFSSYDWTGFIVNLFTFGIPFFDISHIGIMAEYEGELLLFESTTLCQQKCRIKGKHISGSQAHTLTERVKSYRGKVYHYPLVKPLETNASHFLTEYLLNDLGKPYDLLGAIRSSGYCFLRDQDLNNLFCSEWCAAALKAVGRFRNHNASKWNPNKLVREMVRLGITNKRIRYA